MDDPPEPMDSATLEEEVEEDCDVVHLDPDLDPSQQHVSGPLKQKSLANSLSPHTAPTQRINLGRIRRKSSSYVRGKFCLCFPCNIHSECWIGPEYDGGLAEWHVNPQWRFRLRR